MPTRLDEPALAVPSSVRSLLVFGLVAYGVTWGLLTPVALGWVPEGGALALGLYVAGAFGPSVAAVTLAWRESGRAGVRRLLDRLRPGRVPVRWWIVLALPILLKLAAVAALTLAVRQPLDVGHLSGRPVAVLIATAVVAGLVPGAIGEELGWRGYALPRLQSRLGAASASVVLGVVWAGWHLPTFAVPFLAQSAVPPGWFLVEVTAMAVLFTWAFNHTRGSVLFAIGFHAANNAVTPLVYPAIVAAGLSVRFAQLTALVTVIAALAVVAFFGPRTLAGSPSWRTMSTDSGRRR